jgi:two-component system, OmpR family, phosphate regulon sensor histidine kinase PhoR
MYWPLLTLLAFGGLLVSHFWWRARLRRAETALRVELERLKTEQERATLQLQAQEAALFDSMAEGLLVLDERGRIQLANRAFSTLFGVTADIRSRTLIEALRLHELTELVDFLAREKQVVGYEVQLSRPSERWLQVNGAALYNSLGERRGAILVFHDLTRLKQLEKTRQDFVANVSHELRTPLSLIKGYVETLLDGAKDNPEVAVKFLRTIERNAARLQLLIEDLLVISELESGRVQLHRQSLRLSTVVENVFEDFKARAGSRGIELLDQTGGLEVFGDPARLEQVLGNLIENAIKYGRADSPVLVGARLLEAGEVEVAVQDHGPGIPAASLDRLFERFYRVDKARSREQGGTGLGLSIVKHLIQSHGGRVWAKSEPGHGATFFFTLPAA